MAYHVSSKGSLTVCKAQPGKCPLGGKHFENETDGMEYLDNLNNKENLIEQLKNASTPGTRIRLRKEIRLLNQALGLEQDADIPVSQPSKEELERQKRIKEREIEEAKKEKELAENLKVFEAKEFLEIPKNIERLRSNYLYKERYFSRQDMYKSTYRGEQSKENRDHNTGTAMYGQDTLLQTENTHLNLVKLEQLIMRKCHLKLCHLKMQPLLKCLNKNLQKSIILTKDICTEIKIYQ